MTTAAVSIRFEDFWFEADKADDPYVNPLWGLLSKRFQLVLSTKPDFLIYSGFGNEYLKYDCTRIFYTGENQRPDFNECDFAFSFDYPVDERNYRLPVYKLYGYDTEIVNKGLRMPDPSGLEFCSFVYSNNKARERRAFFEQLSAYKPIDSGGRVLNNLGYRVGNKLEFLSRYKFTIAFENSSHPGYTTEKLLEGLIANTVPIYWGNPAVDEDFNPKGFINCHDFSSFSEVIDYVKTVDQDEKLWSEFVSAPVFSRGFDNHFVNEENVLDRFELIFSGERDSRVSGPGDRLKYVLRLGSLSRQFRMYGKRLRGLFW